jgi:hypothetical protein
LSATSRRRDYLNDRFDGCDPQIPENCFVPFRDDRPDDSDCRDDEGARELDRNELLAAVGTAIANVLSGQERHVLIQRLLGGDTYADIARTAWPRLSGPSQARKIERRALRKLRGRLSRFRNDLKPKLDKSDI